MEKIIQKPEAATLTPVEIKNGRGIEENTKILLFARAAGRCELCNKSVIKDLTTGESFIWGEMAHIYAFSDKGPRANPTKTEKNDVDNLLLACPDCHEKIDKKGLDKYYSAEYLRGAKLEHEARVVLQTSFTQQRRTKVLKMVANINGETVKLSMPDIVDALMRERLFSCEERPEEIDYAAVPGTNTDAYWNSKMQEINQIVGKFYSDLKREKIEHVSIFGIGPIPLLMFLGWKLDNKIKTKIFQRHRDGEGWAWNREEPKANYKFEIVKEGGDKNKVAVLLSLSGIVERGLLPAEVLKDYYVYELSLNPNPNYNFLRTERDLFNFEKEFSTAVSVIKNNHSGLKSLDLFPAVPAPAAIVCGRSLNKNSDPQIRIFNTSNKSEFTYTLTIN